MAVSKRLRYEVLRRDNHACRYCGATAPDAPLRVDHVTPVALGGSDAPTNLVTACEPCNSGKTSSTPDASLVADVSADALRWANAMKQAVEELKAQTQPKTAYREHFKQSWNEWTREANGKKKHFDLPDGWKTSIDGFRDACLPEDVWPDIIEKAMTNKTVRADNIFRYCCGIAWRMVGELQEAARAIVGDAAPAIASPVDHLTEAAMELWSREQGEDATPEDHTALRATISAVREEVDPHRIVEGVQYASWFGFSDINDAISEMDSDRARSSWWNAWFTRAGDYPDDALNRRVHEQCEALLAAGVYVSRVERAATYAGSRRSSRLYFGLSDEELAVTGGAAWFTGVVEIWAAAFETAAGRWPSKEERKAFSASVSAACGEADLYIADLQVAAAASGSYQDTQVATCLPRHLSAVDAAARPFPASV